MVCNYCYNNVREPGVEAPHRSSTGSNPCRFTNRPYASNAVTSQ